MIPHILNSSRIESYLKVFLPSLWAQSISAMAHWMTSPATFTLVPDAMLDCNGATLRICLGVSFRAVVSGCWVCTCRWYKRHQSEDHLHAVGPGHR